MTADREPAQQTDPPQSAADRRRPRRATRRRWALGGLAAVLVAGLATWWMVSANRSEPAPAAPQPPRSAEQVFAAAIAQLVRSGGDTIRLDDFHATDEHIQTLANIERLRVIRIDGAALSPAAGELLAAMPHLEQLHLRRAELGDAVLVALAKSRSLWLLNLTGAKVSPEAVQQLAEMPRLRQLRLAIPDGSNRYAAAIGKIERLRSLHLIGIGVNNEGLKHLAALRYLESIYLDETAITEEGWTWLFENHPQLHVHIDQKHHDRDPQRH